LYHCIIDHRIVAPAAAALFPLWCNRLALARGLTRHLAAEGCTHHWRHVRPSEFGAFDASSVHQYCTAQSKDLYTTSLTTHRRVIRTLPRTPL